MDHLNGIRTRNRQNILDIVTKQQEAIIAEQAARGEATAAEGLRDAALEAAVLEQNLRDRAANASDCVDTITQILASVHAKVEAQTTIVESLPLVVAAAAAAKAAAAAEAVKEKYFLEPTATVGQKFVLSGQARGALMRCKDADIRVAADPEVQIATEHLAEIRGIYNHIATLQGSAAAAAESAARLVAPYQYTIDKQQIEGLPESYYGVYVPTRTTPSLGLIYDFRILDFHDIKNYSKLITLNLAMIIAEKLKIEVFRGCLESEDELKFFCFLGFDNRFRYNSDHVEQERLSRLPYIEIKEDIIPTVPFLRIYNYEIEKYRGLVKQKIFLNFLDSRFTQKINIGNPPYTVFSYLNEGDSALISKFYDKNYKYSSNNVEPLGNFNILPSNFSQSVQNYFLSIILFRDEVKKNNNICIELLEDEFLSLRCSCLPTPIIRQQEIEIGDAKVAEGIRLGFYNDITGKYAVAIDPSVKSKDKDDAIFFEENAENNCISMYVYISDVSPYMNQDNLYIFNYAAFKQETEYIGHTRRYPLLDPYLSEDKLSLMGDNRNAIEVKINYERLSDQTINKNPLLVTVQKVRNLKIIYTTYKDVHNTFITVNPDLKLLKDNVNKTVISNNFSMKSFDVVLGDATHSFNKQDLEGNNLFGNIGNPTEYNEFYNQICLMHKYYKIIGLSVDTMNVINTYLDPFSIKFNDSNNLVFDDNEIYDKWIHTLIEITALEVNKYIGLIQYINHDMIKLYGPQKLYSITRDNIEHHLNLNESDLVDNKGFYRKTDLKLSHKWDKMTELPKIVPMSEHSVCYKEFVSQNYIKMNDQWIKKEFTFPVLATNVCKPALHFNINTPFYSWFTSPLRRFFDLAVHNLLFICVDKEITDKFNQTFSNKNRSSTNDSMKFFFVNKNSGLLFKKLTMVYPNANERLILATKNDGFVNCQFFIFNTTFSFPLSVGLTKGYTDPGFYYINDVEINGKNNFDFTLALVPANKNYDSLIMNNILSFLSFLPSIYTNEYIKDIINFSYTSCVKDFMEGRFGGSKNGKNNGSFREKYLKYKLKYLALKNKIL